MVVFFDIDDTLVDSESAHIKSIREICMEYLLIKGNPDQRDREWVNITDKYLKLYFEHKITLEQQRIFRITEFWKSNGKLITEEQAEKVYQQYHNLFLHSCLSFTETISSLQKLKNCKLGIISNGTYSDQIFKLENNHLAHFFEEIIISEKIGFSKPDKEIFLIAARHVGMSPSDCIYVGNSYDIDYLGSLNSGMKAIWLKRGNSENCWPYERIYSLNELASHPYLK